MWDKLNTRRPPLVLHVRGVTGVGGGPEKTILNSPRFLRPLGFNSVCAYMHPPTDEGFDVLRKRADERKAEMLSVADRGPLDLQTLRQLISYCKTNRVSIWHGHDYKSNLFGLIAKRFWPMKLVTTLHGWGVESRRTKLYYAIDRKCLPYYDSVISVSEDLYQATIANGVSPQRAHWIHNAIDLEEFQRQTPIATTPTSSLRPLRLGAMGRLSREKGFDLLIQAVVDLNRSGVPCALQIAGEGDQRASLEQLISKLNCGSQVTLAGHVSNIKSFFEGLDVFVLSSIREGLPNVLLEAMALRVPVVSTRIAGIPRLIQSGTNGILVNPGSIDELKKGIIAMAEDGSKRDCLALAARETIEQSFSFQARMERIAKIYDRLLERNVVGNVLVGRPEVSTI